MSLQVFASEQANARKVAAIRALGADIQVAGEDFDGAKLAAIAYAGAYGSTMVEDGRQIAISEGAGTIACELTVADSPPDVVLVPVGNGALIGALGIAALQHDPERYRGRSVTAVLTGSNLSADQEGLLFEPAV